MADQVAESPVRIAMGLTEHDPPTVAKLNAAVTTLSLFIVTEHEPVPVQSPDQPVNEPVRADWDNDTGSPL
jgi:hypothetical protein